VSVTQTATPGGVTIVTQTRVRAGKENEFARWQQGLGTKVAELPGFIGQTIMPPNPPAQIDWVILQRFASLEAATSWLNSRQRLGLIEQVLPMLVGQDDIHILKDNALGVLPAPVSAVIATRLKPGTEAAYRAWEQKIAAAQSKAKGFQGYRFEPPIPGVQDSWLAIVRFDSDTNLEAWMNSPVRLALLKEAEPFTEEFHARIVRTGFDQWFKVAEGAPPPVAWKMNMLVLLMLYPVVFLFGILVQKPLLTDRGVPFWLALFIGNVVSVALLNWLVPWSARRFGWWLTPQGQAVMRINFIGAGAVVGLYVVCLLAFALWPFAR
jgi:antibiotic biosynthesis monooxygenase (ABM) superfamily enzyme